MRGKRYNLSLICFVLAFLLGIVSLAGCRRRLPYANRMVAAARLHEQAAALIREEKARRGVALAPKPFRLRHKRRLLHFVQAAFFFFARFLEVRFS